MIQATGSQIIIKLLELAGIKTVAGIPGGSILPLYDELERSSIRHILVRQEQAAGFIAQGMARSTGIPAVCMATSGPGAMNLLTAIADARCDSVPIVAITGQVNTSMIGTDAFQEADTFGLSFPITKHSMMVKDARDLLTAVPLAFSIAVSGRPGPVLIDVPRDVQMQVVEFDEWPSVQGGGRGTSSGVVRYSTPKDEVPSIIQAMAQALAEAEKPVLYLGGGCNTLGAAGRIGDFLKVYGVAVVTSLMGIGAVPRSAANNFGMVGMHGSYAANRAMHDADLVLAAGVRFDDRATGAVSKFCPHAKILHIDIDAAEINKILPAAISLVKDVEEAFALLTEAVKKLPDGLVRSKGDAREAFLASLRKTYAETESLILGRKQGIPESSVNPRAFIRAVPQAAAGQGVKPEDIIVTTDVGQHQMWSAQYYPVERPRQFLTSGSLGTMGFGLPTALGAALANPGKRVVCFSGDGSILMNIQELATLAELELDVTIVLFKNGSLGMVRQQQEYLFEKNYSASIFEKVPDFLTVAKGFGIDAVDAVADKDWAAKAFAKGPHFVLVSIDMEENVLPFVSAGRANIDAIRD
ncbi:MAG: biosynthetic-type acetolactate synthase large subunit [Treponema sp.]|nr:biosynthetic-type acetolactate synthase large subunit [Treponema sp.]